MKPALLLIDMQQDFLDRPQLFPTPARLIQNTELLLNGIRGLGLPVCHVHTVMKPDGSDLMPHWRNNNYSACLEGSAGCQSPAALAPRPEEPLFTKRFFNGFADPGLEATLRSNNIDTLIIAGLYLHACVRTTVLAAYELGFRVWVAEDCVASCEPLHASISRTYLEERAATFLKAEEIIDRLSTTTDQKRPANTPTVPAAIIGKDRLTGHRLPVYDHYYPDRTNTIADTIPLADQEMVNAAATIAARAFNSQQINTTTGLTDCLITWADRLQELSGDFAGLMALEIGKPVSDGLEEMRRSVDHVRTAAHLFNKHHSREIALSPPVHVLNCPIGVVAIITPWNNPVAIPAAKISAALAAGNSVVWKPALQSPRTSMALMESMIAAEIGPGLVNAVFGNEETARFLISHTAVAAVTLTGSIETGQKVSCLCNQLEKPLQAELGGNNSAIVMSDCDLKSTVAALVQSAYSFAGQRCTASRRIIVDKNILKNFLELFVPEMRAIKIGDPSSPSTRMGPLISEKHLDNVKGVITRAIKSGAQLLCGGAAAEGFSNGAWFQPTLMMTDDPFSELVQEETFGPVAVVMSADDFDHALNLSNNVRHGLISSIYTNAPDLQKRFLKSAQAGILRINEGPLTIHPDAPFGGWKASSLGPPEHGEWDLLFYSRPQAIYGVVPW